MTKHLLVPVLLSAVLAACSINPPAQTTLNYYDLPAGTSTPVATPLRSIDVVPSSWLAGTAMYYRLAYADSNRREHYVGSRWSGQPAELLTIRLQRSLMTETSSGSNSCRLRVDLDDFVQVFASPQSSRFVLEGRAVLYGNKQSVVARRVLSLSRPSGADASAGVVAAGELADDLARDLQAWVRQACPPAL